MVPTTTTTLGCVLVLALVSPALAEADGEGMDEAALRADARETFKRTTPFLPVSDPFNGALKHPTQKANA